MDYDDAQYGDLVLSKRGHVGKIVSKPMWFPDGPGFFVEWEEDRGLIRRRVLAEDLRKADVVSVLGSLVQEGRT